MLADQFDTFFLDLDGVVYVGKKPLPGAREALDRFRQLGKNIYFLTNDPVPTRQEFVERLHNMDIDVQLEEVITAGWATAHYLQQQKVQRAYVLGSAGLKWEVREAGIEVEDAPLKTSELEGQVKTSKLEDQSKIKGAGQSPLCDAVVVGWDEDITFRHIQKACQIIEDGASFVATNADRSFPGPLGPMPATGAVVKALEVAVDKQATIVGKPHLLMFTMALDKVGHDKRVVMIGDNPETDILGAKQAGLPAVLRADHEMTFSPEDLRHPDARIRRLTDLFHE